MISISHLDHLVLTVKSITNSCNFYQYVLGMSVETFGEGRNALRFGNQKINLHEAGHAFEPKAEHPTPGSADIFLISTTPMDEILAHLEEVGVPVKSGPISRTGAAGRIVSVYIRDLDANLIELSNY